MKKIISIIMVAALAFSLTACTKTDKEESETKKNKKLNIVATVFPGYDFAREIVGNKAEVTMILPCGGETHSYEPTLSDISKIQKCDLFIYVGGSTDSWAKGVLAGSQKFDRTDISMLDIIGVEGETHEDDHDEHEHNDSEDEHVWTSLRNSEKIVNAIAETVEKLDKANSEVYKANAKKYVASLDKLDKKFINTVNTANNKTLAFADRFPFYYFTKDYGLKYVSALHGCSSDTEPTITDLNKVIKTIKTEKLPVAFYIEFSNKIACDKVCSETGAKEMLLHSCHSISQEDFVANKSYLSIMTENLAAVKEALK